MSFTPGPWGLLCSESRGGPRCLVVCPKDNEIASVNPFRELWNEDAELIAAAPDLLEACEALLQINNEREPFTYAGMWEWKKRKYEAEQKARTAIAKARGET